jgi:hypothetical protein
MIHKLNIRPTSLMLKRHRLACSLIGAILLLVPCSGSQTSGKKKVTNRSDLPRFTYPVKGLTSDLLQSPEEFLPLGNDTFFLKAELGTPTNLFVMHRGM